MKTFHQWVEEKKLTLPEIKENTKRAGVASWAYPSAYSGRGYAYPDSYFMPIAADAMFKMKSKPNNKAPADTAAN
jgi:hypothetical protein